MCMITKLLQQNLFLKQLTANNVFEFDSDFLNSKSNYNSATLIQNWLEMNPVTDLCFFLWQVW